MGEKDQDIRKEKSPALAAFLSIFPGMGSFYNGNILKGLSYGLIFAALIVLIVHARGNEPIVFAFLIAGFYIFQIIDSFNEAKRISSSGLEDEERETRMSLFASITILIVGIIFQLANLDLISYRRITELWPLLLIAIGLSIVISYYKKKEGEENGE